MYVSVCTVAVGSAVDEILFPCQIKASAAISVSVELGGCSQNASACQERQTKRKTCREEGRDSNQCPGLYLKAEGMNEDSLVPALL